MSVYCVKGKGWRYDFTQRGTRYTEAWFETKKEAKQAESKRKEEIISPTPILVTPTDMDFLELANKRLDWLTEYKTEMYGRAQINLFKKLVEKWGPLKCGEITTSMVQEFILERAKCSHKTANYYLRLIRALFNFGIRSKYIISDPTEDIDFLPVEKNLKYIPLESDIRKILFASDTERRDYLLTIIDTLARVNEINHLRWEDVDFDKKYVVLWTRKKRDSSLTPRKIAMTDRLYEILMRRFENRDESVKWVFWHRYWSKKQNQEVIGPYDYRGKLMKILCKRAEIKYFGYHAFRHFGASLMAKKQVPLPDIQLTLGHQKITTTGGYIQSLSEGQREAIRIFESHTQFLTQTENGASQALEKLANPV